MNNIYIDCGFYRGNTLRAYIKDGIIDASWTIYVFEPNPDLDTEKILSDFPVPVTLIKKAVWVEDGEIPFEIDLGVRDDDASIKGTAFHNKSKEIMVPSIDFSKFVADQPPGRILCSMDIEGAEFRVLAQMIKDNTITRINELDIEFHHRLNNDYSQEDSQKLIGYLEKHNINVKLKVPLI